jgi:hypothetical protein
LAASSDSCSKESSEPVRMAGTSKTVHESMSARPVVSTTVFCTISAAFEEAPGSDTIQCVDEDAPAAEAIAADHEGTEGRRAGATRPTTEGGSLVYAQAICQARGRSTLSISLLLDPLASLPS